MIECKAHFGIQRILACKIEQESIGEKKKKEKKEKRQTYPIWLLGSRFTVFPFKTVVI